MVHIYGQSGAEKTLLENCPADITSFNDIKTTLRKYESTLFKEKKEFFNNLPKTIIKEKGILEKLNNKQKKISKSWDKKISYIKNIIKIRNSLLWPKIYLIFLLIMNYLDLFIKTFISKKLALRRIKTKIENQSKYIQRLEDDPDEVFEESDEELINNINELESIMESPDYHGTYGELLVSNELKKLNNDFHVFCDVNIEFDDWIRYHGEKNLKSAQMDFVVVSYNGIFLIEVKNWSNAFMKEYQGLSPHEQLDRAGVILRKYLNYYLHFSITRLVTKVLISTKNNIKPDPDYKSIIIKEIPTINDFIKNKRPKLSEEELDQITEQLGNSVI